MSNKRPIAFFGASVTQQKNGYVDYFQKLNPDEEVLKFGYGAMCINDAGIFFIDDVVKINPKICICDWFTTEYMNVDGEFNEYMSVIVQKLSTIDCRVVFLFFPYQEDIRRKQFYIDIEKICEQNNYEIIRVDEKLKNESDILRDYIHTTDFGSALYAKSIDEYLQHNTKYCINKSLMPNKYSKVNCLKIHKGGKKIILKGCAEVLGINIKTGKYSGIVKVQNNESSFEENTWDMWSYFVRDKFTFKGIKVEGVTSLNCLKQKFDFSACRKNIDFSKYPKFLIVKEIYYLGENLSVSGGNKFLYFLAVLQGKFDALLHVLHLY